MNYLDQHLHGPRREQRSAPPVATGAGAWGEVIAHSSGEVTVDLDDDASRAWGPVPYVHVAGSSGTPVAGDRAFLLLDSDGEPALAFVQR